MKCWFCDSKPVHQKLPYIIAHEMRGVVLGVCKSCIAEHRELENAGCFGDYKCMFKARTLMINPRVKHTAECQLCDRSTYMKYRGVSGDDSIENRQGLTDFYAVYYNPIERLYEVSDVEYAHGPDGLVERIMKADMKNLEELKQIIASSVGVNFGSDGVSIDGLPLLDWAVVTKKYNLIEAIGESGIVILNDDTAFALAIENDDATALKLLVKYNLNYFEGAEGKVSKADSTDEISAYDIGMKSNDPMIRSLVLFASINPEMRRILNLDPNELISLERKTTDLL